MSGIWSSGAPFLVGHRGGRGDAWPAENTMSAFERAVAEGAEAVELDVRLSGSGDVLVFHDADLTRMTGGERRDEVARLTTSELRRIPLGADGGVIPTLAEVLAWARQKRIAVNVELKHDGPADVPVFSALVDLARAAARVVRGERGDVLVSSFHPGLLAAIAPFAPRVPRAILTHARQGLSSDAMFLLARPPAFFAIHAEYTQMASASIAAWKRRGLRVGAWTVNAPGDAERLLSIGVDYLITDAPRALRSVLGGVASSPSEGQGV